MKMSDRIDQVFSAAGTSRLKGRIIGRSADGIYRIETAGGTRLRAESEEVYRQGEWVTVLSGRILGRTGAEGGGKVFDV